MPVISGKSRLVRYDNLARFVNDLLFLTGRIGLWLIWSIRPTSWMTYCCSCRLGPQSCWTKNLRIMASWKFNGQDMWMFQNWWPQINQNFLFFCPFVGHAQFIRLLSMDMLSQWCVSPGPNRWWWSVSWIWVLKVWMLKRCWNLILGDGWGQS